MMSRVQNDIKVSLAYASLTQVGIIVVEIGLGLRYLALIHIMGHACLRTMQLLRAPTLLRDYNELENQMGSRLPSAFKVSLLLTPVGQGLVLSIRLRSRLHGPCPRPMDRSSIWRLFRWFDSLERRTSNFMSSEASRGVGPYEMHPESDSSGRTT